MGTLEAKNRIQIRKTKVNKIIISTIGTAGILALAVVAPNVIGVLGKLRFLPQRKMQIKSSIQRMIKAGYIALEKDTKGVAHVHLTERGEAMLASFPVSANDKKRRKWDGKWRIVMYDFTGPASRLRARVRDLLHMYGFAKLQGSVWVSPYDAEDIITLFKAELHIGKNLLYVIADQIENDRTLRERFSLPLR